MINTAKSIGCGSAIHTARIRRASAISRRRIITCNIKKWLLIYPKDLKINQEVDIFTEDCKAIVSFWKRK